MPAPNRYFFVPEYVDPNSTYVPLRYIFEKKAAEEIAARMSRKGQKWRVVASTTIDPAWPGEELNQLPSAF